MGRPLCFVLMPCGRKPAPSGAIIDFDAVHGELIKPAIEQAGLEPLRADEELAGGMIDQSTFERLILCEYAVADLTTADANVFYELGLRHALRPASTVLAYAEGQGRLPFDVAALRGLPYRLDRSGRPGRVDHDRTALARRLNEARKGSPDSPVYRLVDGFPDIKRLKTDVFRERVLYGEAMKKRLAHARRQGAAAVHSLESDLEPIAQADSAVVIDLFLSYRAVKAWDQMIALVDRMSPPLAATVMVQEQLGLALNRTGRREEAERVLVALIQRRGPSSETYGILGRVYKDRWEQALAAGDGLLARELLEKAIDAYLSGFEADWRDAYAGVNVVTLMELREPPDRRRDDLVPIVAYAVERRLVPGQADYWDHATRLELAVLRRDAAKADHALADSLANVREAWEPETTARNLRLIREARERRGAADPWALEAERALEDRAARL